jgi:hypothetical protein
MNRHSAFGLLALAAASLLAPSQPATSDEPACVAHWRFENGVRDIAAADNHRIVDHSGNGQNGFAIGGPIFRRVELPTGNFALEFQDDGDRVWIPDDPGFELGGSITVEAWIQVDRLVATAHQRQIVFRGDARPGLDPWFLAVRDTGQLVFQIADGCHHHAVVTSPTPLPIGRLVHVAGTFDHELGRLQLFVDGAVVATTDTDVRPAARLGGDEACVGIGNLGHGGDQGFRGRIAEVRICAAALSPESFLLAVRRRR